MKFDLTPLARHLLNTVLPPRCPGCGIVQLSDDALCQNCWEDVRFISDPQCNRCGLPFEMDSLQDDICASCATFQPFFDKARSVFIYDDASKRLILNLKHGDRLDTVPAISHWMGRIGQDFIQSNNPILVPVPLHRKRLFKRRFNQSAEIAKSVARKYKLNVNLNILERVKNTQPQGRFSANQRRRNVAGAFKINENIATDLTGANIILIDDVMTTGATVNACSKTLKKAGVREINVLCLARVPKPLIHLT